MGGCYNPRMTVYRSRIFGPGPAGDVWNTTLHTSSSQDLATVHTAVGTFIGAVFTEIGPMWSTEQQITGYTTDALDPNTGKNTAQQSSALTMKGSGSGNALDQRACITFSLRTALPTRAGRGRMYWPGLDDTHLTTTGLWSSTDCQSLATAAASALGTLAGTAQPVIYHRDSRTFTAITQVEISQIVNTQRRRTNKVLPNYQSANL